MKSIKGHQHDIFVFGLSNGEELAASIAEGLKGKVKLGKLKRTVFANGEIFVKPESPVRGCHVFIVQSLCQGDNFTVNDSIMELLVFLDAMRRANVRSINAIIPNFAYARQDRKTLGREPISAKLLANLLTVAGVERLTCFDLHTRQIQGFFDYPVDDLRFGPLAAHYLLKKQKAFKDKYVIVAPDVGALARCTYLSEKTNNPMGIIHKQRTGVNQSKVLGFTGGDIENVTPIIFDDMIDTGGTILNAAKFLVEKHKTKSVIVCATHAMLSNEAEKKLIASKYIKEIIISNSVPSTVKRVRGMDKIKILGIEQFVTEVTAAWIIGNSISSVYSRFLDLDNI